MKASRITRTADRDDVRLEGPVTKLDRLAPALEVLGQPIPIDGFTRYFDAAGQERGEEQFFRTPGDVEEGDIVSAVDLSAADPAVLSEADEVTIESD